MPLFKKYSFAVLLLIKLEKKNFPASRFTLYNNSFFCKLLSFFSFWSSNVIFALAAKYFTASKNDMFLFFITKLITFPASPHPKHLYICLSCETENEGDFSLWNGHNPIKFLPDLLSLTVSEITSTISFSFLILSRISSEICKETPSLPNKFY